MTTTPPDGVSPTHVSAPLPPTISAVLYRPWYLTALLLARPLHFGDYGGLPMQLLWAALDVLTLIVLGSGLYLWLRKGKA